MFAYCNNCPADHFDAGGHQMMACNNYMMTDAKGGRGIFCSHHVSAIQTIGPSYTTSVKNSAKSTIKSTGKLFRALYYSADITAGIGQGLDGSFEVLGVGVTAGGYGNYIQLHFVDGSLKAETASCLHIVSSYWGKDIGFATTDTRPFNGEEYETNNLIVYDIKDHSVSLFSGECYLLFLGGSFNIAFDYRKFYKMITGN